MAPLWEGEIVVSSGSAQSVGEEELDEDYNDCSYEEKGGEDEDKDSPSSNQEWKSQNVADFVRGNLVVKRQPLVPRILSVSEAATVARKPFKPPCGKGYRDHNEELAQCSCTAHFGSKEVYPLGLRAAIDPYI